MFLGFSRTTFTPQPTWYYTFLEFPFYLHYRKEAWFILCGTRSTILEDCLGGVSALTARIMRYLFVDNTSNFEKGFYLTYNGAKYIVRVTFKGFIADEKGLKCMYDVKGASGTKPCIGCQNVFNFIHKRRGPRDAGKLGLDITSLDEVAPHDDASIIAAHDRLLAASLDPTVNNAAFEEMQKLLGINFNPLGILGDQELRPFLRPVSMYFRDLQHTLASGGVASTELAVFLNLFQKNARLKAAGVTLERLSQYAQAFTLPRSQGKPNLNWFHSSFLAKDHVKHFSSDVLSMYPILVAFAVDAILPCNVLQDNVRCLILMEAILSMLCNVPVVTDAVYEKLNSLIMEHARLFQRLYPAHIKVKFHHMLHLAADLKRLGFSISCFAMERRHRDWKSVVLWAFRSFELSSTRDAINCMVHQIVAGQWKFDAFWLDNPREAELFGVTVEVARGAHTPYGLLRSNDLVLASLGDGVVGRVGRFFCINGGFFVEFSRFMPIDDDWSLTPVDTAIIDLSLCRSALAWAPRNSERMRVLIPSAFR